jgi:hypothetical protein
LESALAPIAVAINSAVGPYSARIGSDLNQSLNTTEEGGGVTSAGATAFWSDFGGVPFMAALGIGVVIEVVLNLLMPFELGPSFLIDVVLTLFGAAAGFAVAALAGAAQLSTSAVSAVESLVVHLPGVPPPLTNPDVWATISGLIAVGSGLASLPFAFGILWEAFQPNPSPAQVVWAAPVNLALDLVAIGIAVYALAHPSLEVAAFTLFASIAALAVSVYHFLTSTLVKVSSDFALIVKINLGLSTIAAIASAADLAIHDLT